ncbi:MAG TPA: hypothetical protein VIJ34_16970 [Acidimicrobiales bacterium]
MNIINGSRAVGSDTMAGERGFGRVRGMRFVQRRSALFVMAVAMASVAATPLAGVAAASARSTIHASGVQTINYSGPAKVTLVIGGKPYAFKNGECASIKVSGITVDLAMGSIVQQTKTGATVSKNSGKPYFSLDLSPGQNSDLLGTVWSGGKELTGGGIVSVSGTVAAKGTSKGTFKSAKGAYDALGKPFSVSGSWNCEGAFAKH